MRKLGLFLKILTSFTISACTHEVDESGFALNAEDPELGKSTFDPAQSLDGKEDGLRGQPGMEVAFDTSSTAVWEIKNQWMDTDTPAALEAGMAWEANSGLTWDEKYSRWVALMEKSSAASYGNTFTFITPFGKTLPAPSLECAETSLFLRGAFASWYGLPFFVEARDANGDRLFLGHFGFRTLTDKYANSPDFKTTYKDFSAQASDLGSRGWPEDAKLRSRRLGGSQDDEQPALFEGAHAGTYFDEIFLNKRTGYFMIYLLSYFGSVNLADPSNTFNIKADAIRPGDTLLHRWQRRGIGHTLVVKSVVEPQEGFMEVELVSGSMPRRQPSWDSPSTSKYNLTVSKAGGLEESHNDGPYVKLGGGLKRWRVATLQNGLWVNDVPATDKDVYINSRNYEELGGRIEKFEELLKELSPELKREGILERIIAAREHLRLYPASCAARVRREDAFKELYELESTEFYTEAAEVDGTYRRLEDYVFAPLSYDESKTCCWNSTTQDMYEIIMDYAQSKIDEAGDACVEPIVFKATDGGYDIWREHAANMGRAESWVSWSEDESCPQRDTNDDVISKDYEIAPLCSAPQSR